MDSIFFPKLIIHMKLKCRRHNKVNFISYGFLGLKSRPTKVKIDGITRGKSYDGQLVQVKVWTPDYDQICTMMCILNDHGEWENYDMKLFTSEDNCT